MRCQHIHFSYVHVLIFPFSLLQPRNKNARNGWGSAMSSFKPFPSPKKEREKTAAFNSSHWNDMNVTRVTNDFCILTKGLVLNPTDDFFLLIYPRRFWQALTTQSSSWRAEEVVKITKKRNTAAKVFFSFWLFKLVFFSSFSPFFFCFFVGCLGMISHFFFLSFSFSRFMSCH